MYRLLAVFIVLTLFLGACQSTPAQNDNEELQKLVDADQNDRSTDSDEPIAPKDDIRRKRVLELLAKNQIVTPQDKYNAALILQHTGMVFVGNKLTSKSVENHYLAYQLVKSAFEEGYEDAQYFVAVTYDRYSWMSFGYQKYGTQTTYIDDKPVWVTIDPTTTNEERAQYNVPHLEVLLKQKPMQ